LLILKAMEKEKKRNVARQNPALIYKILLDDASEKAPLPIRGKEGKATILSHLEEDYGVKLNHHTISDILHALKDYGLVDIVGGEERGRWYPIRTMDEDSTAILLLSLYGNNNLTGPQIEGIEKQLAPVIGLEVPEKLQATMPKEVTTWNQMMPTYFQVINDAIKRNKQIGYVRAWNTLDNKTMIPNEGKKRKRVVNPLGIANFRGDFYLVFSRGGRDQISLVRLDNIAEMQIERSPRLTPEGFNMKEWLKYRPYAFSDPIEEFEVMVTHSDEKHNQYRDLSYIRQYFGNEPKLWVDENDHRIHAKIKTSRLCFKYWYISYAWEFTIISPEDIKIEIREHAEEILQKCGAK